MALPLIGINTTIVAQAIGLASNNVGELCIRAASGGVMTTTETPNFNSAFMVSENGEGETFYASYGNGRPSPGANQYLQVMMEYV